MKEHLTEAVQEYIRAARLRLHVPAHGGGRGNPGLDRLWPGLLTWDVTEQPELDDLSHPEGPIRDAQREAADLMGAAAAYFLTGGATLGMQAAILAAVGAGVLLLARDSHRSALSGLALSGGEAVLVPPGRDPVYGVSLGLEADAVRRASIEHPDLRAVLVTYPTYLGIAPPLQEIVDVAHRSGLQVIVDAAHGAHFGLHPDLPESALRCGADVVILGMHKSGGALTQSAMLALSHGAPAGLQGQVELALRLLQSSSPSYLLLTSIEQALVEMARGAPGVERAIAEARGVVGPARVHTRLAQDPLRIGLRLPDAESAMGLADRLRAQGMRGEYREGRELLYVVPWGEWDLSPLREEVERLSAPSLTVEAESPTLSRVRPREALLGRRAEIPFSEAAGHIAADVVGIVPPGIPALWPGERISAAVVRKLLEAEREGQRIMGIENQSLWVVAE